MKYIIPPTPAGKRLIMLALKMREQLQKAA